MNFPFVHTLLKRDWVYAIAAGVGLGIGFVVPMLWWMALVAIVMSLTLIERAETVRRAVLLLAIIWGIKALLSIIWFWSAFPIDWVPGMSIPVQLALISVYWVTSGLWLSSGGVLFALASYKLLRQQIMPNFAALILLPFVWVASEIFSAGIFSIFTAGPGSFIQSYFSFGMVGYLLANSNLGIWLAGWAAVYGLGLVLVGVAVGLWKFKRTVSPVQLGGVLILMYILATFIPWTESDIQSRNQTVIAIDTDFDPGLFATDEGYQAKNETVRTAVNEALEREPDVILLPEDSRYGVENFDIDAPKQTMAYWQFNHKNTPTILIDSGRHTTASGDTVLRANVFDGASGQLWQFDKQYLVPQGEYVPLAYGFVLKLLGYGSMVDAVARDSSYRPGPLNQTVELPDSIPGVLFCFESVNPNGVSRLAQTRSLPFIAHPISHGWFHTPTILWQQLTVMLQVQARYSGVPIVSAGNMVAGKLYLPSGEIQTGTVVAEGERYRLREFTF